jgi:hypothetical protein
LHKQQGEEEKMKENGLLLGVNYPFSWIPSGMASTNNEKFVRLFTLAKYVKPSVKPMITHLPAEAESNDLRCQGFAVIHYSFTLDALDLQHPSAFATLGYRLKGTTIEGSH